MPLENINQQICLEKSQIIFSHENCSQISKSDNFFLLKEETGDCNILTKFEILSPSKRFLLYFHWAKVHSIDTINFYYCELTEVFFLATNQVFYTVNLQENSLINSSYETNLQIYFFHRFKKFAEFPNYVLAMCEMDVVVFDLQGKIISSTFAEPPYKIELKNQDLLAINELNGKEFFILKKQ